MSKRPKPDGPYFIYALLDPRMYRETKDDLRSIFYVGKGGGSRPHQHALGVRKALLVEEQVHERLESKAHRIHQILDRGELIPILYLAEGIVNEDDAYNAEQLAMTLIDGLLRRCGDGALTNAIPGRHQGIRRAGESDMGGISAWEKLLRKDNVNIGSRTLNLSTAGPASVILVKGSRLDSAAPGQRLSRGESLPYQLQEFAASINLLEVTDDPPTHRRGWDPDDPWDDVDARERARRYWRFGRDRVADWMRDPKLLPKHLLMGVETPSAETVVRYAWDIDPTGQWEYFPDGSYWGVPLGRRNLDHPFLNRALYETKPDGREMQVLQARAAGWRHITC